MLRVQARQAEELEHLRRMIDKNPEVIRFAMECQTLRGTARCCWRRAGDARVLTVFCSGAHCVAALDRLAATRPPADPRVDAAAMRRLQEQVASLTGKLKEAVQAQGPSAVTKEEHEALKLRLEETEAALAAELKRTVSLVSVRASVGGLAS